MSEPLHVALPLGIGDCHWACQKMRGLSEYYGGRPIHAHVNCSQFHTSYLYLAMVPFVAEAMQDRRAPFSIAREMPPTYLHPKWSALESCRGWNGFDYILVANGHLERGERIETWLPEIPTDFTYRLNIPDEADEKMRGIVGENPPVIYMSGTGPNQGFHNNTWTLAHWVRVIELLNAEGVVPVLIGANSHDIAYRDQFIKAARKGSLRFIDLVGATTHAEVCALIRRASFWVGLNSGTGIVSAMMGTPTIMFWADSSYETGAPTRLHPNMQTSWLAPVQLETYRTFSYGSPELNPESAVNAIMTVKR